MMRRICQAEYSIPDSPLVSHECRHLLQSILVADPARRLTVPAILQHPWLAALRTEAAAEQAQPPQRLGRTPQVPYCPNAGKTCHGLLKSHWLARPVADCFCLNL